MTKSTKKKLIAIGICFVILVASILSNTIAYFTDDEKVINTFTSGNVEITLDEAVVEKDAEGNLVAKDEERFIPTETNSFTHKYGDYSTIYPGMSITKDPTITNTGEEKAYIAAKIVISNTDGRDLTTLFTETPANDTVDVLNNAKTKVATTKDEVEAAVASDAFDYVVYKKDDTDAKTNTLLVYVKAPVAANGKVVLFDTMLIPTTWGNAEKTLVDNLKIDVTAYGIQTFGFANGYEAAVEAFEGVFKLA